MQNLRMRALTTKPPSASSSSTPANEPTPPAEATPTPAGLPTLDFSPSDEPPQGDGGRTGARSSKDSLSSIEQRRRYLGQVSLAMLALGLGMYTVSLGGEWTPEELKEKRMTLETAPSTRWGRTVSRFNGIFDIFTKPIWNELLPPPLPEPNQKPYTLLLSLDDLLVTSTWDVSGI